jgi:hypothetical protein
VLTSTLFVKEIVFGTNQDYTVILVNLKKEIQLNNNPQTMNCESYQNLSLREQIESIGELVHLYQSDEESHKEFESILRSARQHGKFEGVTILPRTITETDLIETP